jgi:hypothetical protein
LSDKGAILKLLDREHQNLRQAIDGLDESQLSRVWFGDWSVKDIIAHVLGWEREMTGALQRLARGEGPIPEGVDYSNIDEWNAKLALEMAPIGAATVLATWRQVHMNYAKAAKAVPDDQYGEDKTVNRLLQLSGFGHYREHAAQIHEWRQREGL